MHNATNVDLTSYAASKAATDHLVRLLAAKFSRFYVRVSGINPGCEHFCPLSEIGDELTCVISILVVPSNMNPVGEEGNMFSSLFDKVPAKRAGNEHDIAGAVLYLASRAGVRPCFPPTTAMTWSWRIDSRRLTSMACRFVLTAAAFFLPTGRNKVKRPQISRRGSHLNMQMWCRRFAYTTPQQMGILISRYFPNPSAQTD
jgi:hypothetical protein